MTDFLLTLIIFTPVLGSIILMLVPAEDSGLVPRMALGVMIIEVILTIFLGFEFSLEESLSVQDSFQLVEKSEWINFTIGQNSEFNIAYHIGVDGISLPLVLLSSFILLLGVIASWSVRKNVKGYFILYLLLATSIQGCFLALDFFLFYLFFELMLLPMFFLIGIWGGNRSSYASIKFFIYTLVGSLLILAVMIGLYLSVYDPDLSSGEKVVHTFNILHMIDFSNYLPGSVFDPAGSFEIMGHSARYIAFVLLAIGFIIKLPGVPFHTWLPDAHVEAPTAISVILAALLLKVGGYGLFRIAFLIFPDGAIHFAYPLAGLGVLSIVYGGLNAIGQRDFKRMIAYSSVSHMGFVLVGLASLTYEGAAGALFHMISHGLISAGLFLVVGVIYDRAHNRRIENFSGLASKLPGYTFVVVILFFASLGLPGFSGFVGEVMVLIGAFSAATPALESIPVWIGVTSISGIILSAIYYLWTLQRMFFGEYWIRSVSDQNSFRDLSAREWILFVPLIILILLLGIYPKLLLDVMDNSVGLLVDHVITNGNYLTGE